MAGWRRGPMGQPLHHAPALSVRPALTPHSAPHADQRPGAAFLVNKLRVNKTWISAPRVVLSLLCVMYLILFVDRVSISTAGPLMRPDLGISNTQLGLAFSAFAIPYALFQLIGGWIGDKFGPRLTLSACCGMVALSTILTGAAAGFVSLFALRLALGFGEGAAFPTATRAMSNWTPVGSWGFAQGITHSFARIGNALTPPLMAGLLAVVSWRISFVILGAVSLEGNAPGDHREQPGHQWRS